VGACGALDPFGRKHWCRRAFEPRQVVHEIVERLELPGGSIAQHLIEPPLGLSREQRDPHLLGAPHVRIALGQHGDGAGYVEATDPDLKALPAQGPCDIGARGNWLDCTPTSATMPASAPSISLAMRFGRMRVFVSSHAWTSISVSSPRHRRSAQSRASP